MDLETGLQVKKTRTGAESVVSNLVKSKSKSMMNISGESGGAKSAATGGAKTVTTGGVKSSATGGARPKMASNIEAKLGRQTGGSTLVDRAGR